MPTRKCGVSMRVWMDTTRPNRNLMPALVECTANITIEGEDVRLSVIAFGEGRTGTDKAFECMEKVLDRIDILGQIDEKVRVY
jgi:hypothetical protein